MNRFNIPLIAEGLTTYAMERQNGLDRAVDDAEQVLQTMTARLPIRFTRVLLGGDDGPFWECGFVSGCVNDAEAVKATAVYERACRLHPEIKEWPVLCNTYVGGTLLFTQGTVDASEYDLAIINRAGDDFLKSRKISHAGGPHQMIVPACKFIQVLKVEPGKTPESIAALYAERFAQPMPSPGNPNEPTRWEFHIL